MTLFTADDLVRNKQADRLGIDNTPCSDTDKINLILLVEHVLNPLVEVYGNPIHILCGYRSDKLNEVIKGSAKSPHLHGHAVDITCGTEAANRRLYKLIHELNLPVTECVDRFNYRYIHITYVAGKLKRKYLHETHKKSLISRQVRATTTKA